MKILSTGLLCVAALALLLSHSAAQTETVLHAFGAPTTLHDGSAPAAPLILGADGNYYGTTTYGGASSAVGLQKGHGTLYKITPTGNVTILHSFQDGTVEDDGSEPMGGMILGPDGNFYGTTSAGGSTKTATYAGAGTLFKMTPQGVLTILHDFGDGTVAGDDGRSPQSTLTLGKDGCLYGTTARTGTIFQESGGTVFKATLAGEITILHRFEIYGINLGGTSPQGIIQGRDGNFYGTTSYGGTGGYGTVFKMTPDGQETILHQFQSQSSVLDGAYPFGNLIEGADGEFYGTTADGKGTQGTIFEITSSGKLTILYFFGPSRSNGVQPLGGLVQDAKGNFYGTTTFGGSYNDDGGHGTIFKINKNGILTTLHFFVDSATLSDGQQSQGSLMLTSQGDLIGTTTRGGAADMGTVFQVTPSGSYTILHSFQEPVLPDGQNPTQGLAGSRP